ncbi:class II fructose-bisphosphate aldolase [Breznakiella homolactica]|uniref:Class II fructose-bisphosphate aldolase n=1 Tax=Breznakiella homolactica TaxID=2798577 RepID=A0A7T7XNG4_9SPIR|nr:class II fructose-bisphosphate aldolase [Breznakiella homolactica]QQO09551.1 class II fructose-bisphosphate aldolase [Breznakiella homolactica]
MLVTLNEVLKDARKNKYAVGMFNATNLEMAKGIIRAAEETQSPVIFGTAEVLLPIAGLEELSYFLIPMAKKAKVPVVVHFDHGLTEANIFHALKAGFTSVMYDCSTDTYGNNIKRVAALTKAAHNFGASVEGELGHVGANENAAESSGGDDHSIYTDPKQAQEYAERTGVDALAVAIGNAHGAYTTAPKLDIGILKQISSDVSCPLVLHGGSGLSADDFRNCIREGICKVNIFTDINNTAARYIAGHYKDGMGYTDLEIGVTEAIQAEVVKKLQLFGSVNRA